MAEMGTVLTSTGSVNVVLYGSRPDSLPHSPSPPVGVVEVTLSEIEAHVVHAAQRSDAIRLKTGAVEESEVRATSRSCLTSSP